MRLLSISAIIGVMCLIIGLLGSGSMCYVVVDQAMGQTPTIQNVVINTSTVTMEKLVTLESGVNKVQIKERGTTAVQFAFNTKRATDEYITIPAGNVYFDDMVYMWAGKTMVFYSASVATLEIMTWR